MAKTIYWAAPPFTQAEQLWNRACADRLRKQGYEVILPQDDGEQFRKADGTMDFLAMAKDCRRKAIDADIMVAVLDGPDVDSGTSLEAGMRREKGGKPIIGVRTDFRSSEDDEIGVNAMFRLLDTIVHYHGDSVDELCKLIVKEIRTHDKKKQ